MNLTDQDRKIDVLRGIAVSTVFLMHDHRILTFQKIVL